MMNTSCYHSELIDTTNTILSIIKQKAHGVIREIVIDGEKFFYNEKSGNVFSVKRFDDMLDMVGIFIGMKIYDDDDEYVDILKDFRDELTERCFSLITKYNIEFSGDESTPPIRNPDLFVYIDSIVGRNKELDENDLVGRKRQILTRKYVDFLRAKYIEAYYDEDFGDLAELERKMQRIGFVYQESEKEAEMKNMIIDRIYNLYQFLGRNETVDKSLSLESIVTLYNNLLVDRDAVVAKWKDLEHLRKQYIRLCRLAYDIVDIDSNDDVIYSYDMETMKQKINEIKDSILCNDEESRKIKEKRIEYLRNLYIELVYDAEHRIPLPAEYENLDLFDLREKCVDYCDYEDYRLTAQTTEDWDLREIMQDRFFDIAHRRQNIEEIELIASGPSEYESYEADDFERKIGEMIEYVENESIYDNTVDESKIQIINHIRNEYKNRGIQKCLTQLELHSVKTLETISNLVDIGVDDAEKIASEVVMYK